eukprot:SAG31_NODE_10463_length_1135_cov_3.364865_1_plen_78_part_00
MAPSFAVKDYRRKRRAHDITLHATIGKKVKVRFLPGPTDFLGTVTHVTATTVVVEFEDNETWTIKRYGEEAECVSDA